MTSKSYDITSIFQDDGLDITIFTYDFIFGDFGFAYQISVTFLHSWLRYQYSQLLKRTSVVEFSFRFRFSSSRHHRYDTLHQPTKFYPNWPSAAEV